jgi:hypothetical protein
MQMSNELVVVTKPTVEEVMFVTEIKSGASYKDLVLHAKMLLRQRDLISLKIAKMAIEVCTIRHGGMSQDVYTLSDFATDIGLSRKVLSSWTITYKTVVQKIENEIKTKEDWNKAQKLSDRLIKQRTILRKQEGLKKGEKSKFKNELDRSAKEILAEFRDMDKNSDQIYECFNNCRRALGNIRQAEKATLAEDISFLNQAIENADRIIEIAEAIKVRAKELRVKKTK